MMLQHAHEIGANGRDRGAVLRDGGRGAAGL